MKDNHIRVIEKLNSSDSKKEITIKNSTNHVDDPNISRNKLSFLNLQENKKESLHHSNSPGRSSIIESMDSSMVTIVTKSDDEEGSPHSELSSRSKRITLPPTANARVDRKELRKQLAKGSAEMDECITNGTLPIFGYPLVCYSPRQGATVKAK